MWRLTLALLLLFQSAALGFVPVAVGNRQSISRFPLQQSTKSKGSITSQSPSQLWMSEIDNDDNKLNVSASTEETPSTPELPEPKKKLPEPLLQAMRFVDNAYYVFVLSAGAFFTCGILLNLFGYGWAFTKDGFKVDTIQHMKLEHQFEMAAKQMAKSETRPPSSLPK